MPLIALVSGLVLGAIVASAFWWSAARRAATRAEAHHRVAEARAGALQGAVAELRASLDALPEGVVLVDREGAPIVRNQHADRFLGVAHLDALVGESVEQHLRDALNGNEHADTLEIHGPPRRTLVIRGSVVSVDDQAVGALATVEDITERVRLDSVRTDLVANISHELKTPVGAIALLAETLADEDEPEVIARLGPKLIGEAHRLARIIDELLELSRIELGEQSLAEVVALDAVVEEAVALHRALADSRGISVHADVPDPGPNVVGNKRQMLSAVGNLVENAIKYSDAGSEVGVQVSVDDGDVEVVVRDHGMGIPGRDLDRIFERFYRVDKARSRETGGSGLGLSIVRHVMANHGGLVTVTSAEGEGSTFTLHFPVAPDRRFATGTAPPRLPEPGSARPRGDQATPERPRADEIAQAG
jgi:two-component system sensor histidine kinase SenX3